MSTILGTSFAQNFLENPQISNQYEVSSIESLDVVKSHNLLKGATTDTAGWTGSGLFHPEFTGQASIMGDADGGYVFGTKDTTTHNGTAYALNTLAQGYANSNNSTAEIKEILVWFIDKYQSSNTGTIKVRLYEMAENKAVEDWTNFDSNTSLTAEGPAGNALVEMDLLVADIDTGTSRTSLNITSIMLSSPVSVNGNFAIEIDANAFIASGDTIGIAADDGSSDMNYTFQRFSNLHYWGTTKSFYNSSIGNNMAVFAVVGDNNVGVGDEEYYNGVQLSAFPNPAVENTTISFNLEKNFENVSVHIMDANGKIVNKIEKGNLQSGLYNEVMSVSDLSAGTYYYTIYADNTKLTKSFNVVK